MDSLPLLGLVCVAYSLFELTLAVLRPSRPLLFRFGAVDTDSGRPIEVVCDRRSGFGEGPGVRARA